LREVEHGPAAAQAEVSPNPLAMGNP